MPLNSVPSPIWTSDARLAQLNLAGFAGTLNLSRPCDGLCKIHTDHETIAPTSLFRICSNPSDPDETIADTYTRGRDLVVRYDQRPDRAYSLHLYWRGFVEVSACGVDQIVSTQTDQLDSDPTVVIEHKLPPGSTAPLDTCSTSVLFRPHAASYSWLFAAHRADCEELSIDMEDAEVTLIRFRIFRAGLEKGVIRRAVLRAALLPSDEMDAALRCEEAFLDADLPLTS